MTPNSHPSADANDGGKGHQATGADQLLSVCVGAGIDRLFGLPGVHNLPVWTAAASVGVDIVVVRHEQTAVYAADAYARVTRRLAAAFVTTGPGAANTLAATGEAFASQVPVVVVATDIARTLQRPGVYRGVLHENRDQQQMFKPVTKWAATAATVDEIPRLMAQAIAAATTAPQGPVYLGVPTDLLSALASVGLSSSAEEALVPPTATAEALDTAAALVNRANRPVVWVGGGAKRGHAGAAVADLAAMIGAPIITTYTARGVVHDDNPDLAPGPPHVPMIGQLWDEADLVVSIGSDLDAMTTQNWRMPQPPDLLVINVDPSDGAKNYRASAALPGEASASTAALTSRCADRPERRAETRARMVALRDNVDLFIEADEPQAHGLLRGVEAALPDSAALVLDMCIPGYWLAGLVRLRRGQSLLYPMGWGTLGYGVPAAVGAARSGVDRVVCVVGDGGFLFAPGELATIAQEQLPVTVVIVDDGAYGMLKYDQQAHGVPVHGTELKSPDFHALARSFDLEAVAVTGFGGDFAAALARLTSSNGPNVLVVTGSLKPPVTSSARWYRHQVASNA